MDNINHPTPDQVEVYQSADGRFILHRLPNGRTLRVAASCYGGLPHGRSRSWLNHLGTAVGWAIRLAVLLSRLHGA